MQVSNLHYWQAMVMPRKDGTGPPQGGGKGKGRGGKGSPHGVGAGGNCVCPKCGHTTTHTTGQPCNTKVCTHCGTTMTKS